MMTIYTVRHEKVPLLTVANTDRFFYRATLRRARLCHRKAQSTLATIENRHYSHRSYRPNRRFRFRRL